MNSTEWPPDWLRGVLELTVLRVLAEGPSYGYAIATRLEQEGFGAIKGGTLYPLLTRLEKSGEVRTEWQAGEGGPGRKYFTLSSAGQNRLRDQSREWADFAAQATAFLLTPPPAQGGHDTDRTPR